MAATTPNATDPCWDCGSTVPGHHTTCCDMADPDEAKDLPCTWNGRTGSQRWLLTAPQPNELATVEAARLLVHDDRDYTPKL